MQLVWSGWHFIGKVEADFELLVEAKVAVTDQVEAVDLTTSLIRWPEHKWGFCLAPDEPKSLQCYKFSWVHFSKHQPPTFIFGFGESRGMCFFVTLLLGTQWSIMQCDCGGLNVMLTFACCWFSSTCRRHSSSSGRSTQFLRLGLAEETTLLLSLLSWRDIPTFTVTIGSLLRTLWIYDNHRFATSKLAYIAQLHNLTSTSSIKCVYYNKHWSTGYHT